MTRDLLAKHIRRPFRDALVLFTAILPAAGLLACGGEGSSDSTTAPSVASVTTTISSPAAPPAKPAPNVPRSSPPSGPATSGSGGGAESFRAPHADNSIPDYGSEAAPSEQKRAAAALAGYLQARARGEWSNACSYLTAPTRRELETELEMVTKAPKKTKLEKRKPKPCGPALEALTGGSGQSTGEPRVGSLTGGVAALRVKGDSAFALFNGPENSKYMMPMRNENGAWKVSDLIPLPYPTGVPGAAP